MPYPAETTARSGTLAILDLARSHVQPCSQITSLLFELEQLGATLRTEPSTSDVVVTSITMRRRLERHLTWTSALARDVVTPQWVAECARTGTRVNPQLFPAIREPEPRGTKRKLSETELRLDMETQSQSQSQSQGSQIVNLHSPVASSSAGTGSPSSPTRSLLHAAGSSKPPSTAAVQTVLTSTSTSASTTGTIFSFTQPQPNGTSPAVANPRGLPPADLLKTKFSPLEIYAVQRLHPIICPNQALVADLSVIRFVALTLDLPCYLIGRSTDDSASSKAKIGPRLAICVSSRRSKRSRPGSHFIPSLRIFLSSGRR